MEKGKLYTLPGFIEDCFRNPYMIVLCTDQIYGVGQFCGVVVESTHERFPVGLYNTTWNADTFVELDVPRIVMLSNKPNFLDDLQMIITATCSGAQDPRSYVQGAIQMIALFAGLNANNEILLIKNSQLMDGDNWLSYPENPPEWGSFNLVQWKNGVVCSEALMYDEDAMLDKHSLWNEVAYFQPQPKPRRPKEIE
jgi:hypothetical protein